MLRKSAVTLGLILLFCGPARALELIKLDHQFFVVHYDVKVRLARYVEYELERSYLIQSVAIRKNNFVKDELINIAESIPVHPNDYKGSNFDKGHLAPAADFAFLQEASDATFVMSNIAPQVSSFNSGSWFELEEQVRRWACGEEKLKVFVGPIIRKTDPKLASGLPVPQKFFKIVIDETPPRRSRAFVLNQSDLRGTFLTRETTVKDVEQLTGLKFNVPKLDRLEWREENCSI